MGLSVVLGLPTGSFADGDNATVIEDFRRVLWILGRLWVAVVASDVCLAFQAFTAEEFAFCLGFCNSFVRPDSQ